MVADDLIPPAANRRRPPDIAIATLGWADGCCRAPRESRGHAVIGSRLQLTDDVREDLRHLVVGAELDHPDRFLDHDGVA